MRGPPTVRRTPYLEVQRPLVGQIRLVPCQSYYDVGAGLSLKLFDPVFRPHKRLLPNQKRSCAAATHSFNNHATQQGEPSSMLPRTTESCPISGSLVLQLLRVSLWSWQQRCWLRATWTQDSPRWLYHTPLWPPEPLCSTWVPDCGSAPAQPCPRSQIWLLCHPDRRSESGRQLWAGQRTSGHSDSDRNCVQTGQIHVEF